MGRPVKLVFYTLYRGVSQTEVSYLGSADRARAARVDSMDLLERLPTADELCALSPPALAIEILRTLQARTRDPHRARAAIHPGNYAMSHAPDTGYPAGYPERDHKRVRQAIMEGFAWLIREGLIVPVSDGGGYGNGHYQLSRKGASFQTDQDLAGVLIASAFSPELLHPVIAREAWQHVLTGNTDTAVFAAFKSVEIAVREAAGLRADDLGPDLMRKAFDKNSGALRNEDDPPGEREAIAHVFAGSMGAFRNPSAHRYLGMTQNTALELLMMASHLMRIVDERRPS